MPRRMTALLVCATLAFSSGWAFASAGGCGSKIANTELTKFTVTTGEPLYGFSTDGNLYKADFNGSTPQLLARHYFDSEVSFTRSPDKRWVAYGGSLDLDYQISLNNLTVDQFWLYDTNTGAKRLVLERPAWSLIGAKARFSPNSRWLATTSDLDSRHPSDRFPGVYLIDVHRGKTTYLGYPPGMPPRKDRFSSIEWSRDGTRLLLYMIEGGSKRSYFSIDPDTHAFQTLSGNYKKDVGRLEFLMNSRKIPLQEKYLPQSRIGYGNLSSGSTKAFIDEQYRLIVMDASGKSHLVAKGSYEQCEGITIRIRGWIAEGRYLVYSISGESYIVDLRTFKQKTLALGPISAMNYFW